MNILADSLSVLFPAFSNPLLRGLLFFILIGLMVLVNAEKAFKVPGGLIIPFVGIASIAWVLTSLSVREIISTIIFIALICVIYFTMKGFGRKET